MQCLLLASASCFWHFPVMYSAKKKKHFKVTKKHLNGPKIFPQGVKVTSHVNVSSEFLKTYIIFVHS